MNDEERRLWLSVLTARVDQGQPITAATHDANRAVEALRGFCTRQMPEGMAHVIAAMSGFA